MTPLEAALAPRARSVLRAIRPALAAAGRPEPDMARMFVGPRSIREFSSYDGLSRAILDHDIPAMEGSVAVDHYTTGGGFEGIVSSRELRLAPITLRLGEGELDTFAVEHGLRGYVDARGAPKAALAHAAADLFYTSFTDPAPSAHLWRVFGDGGDGCRLRFEITTGRAGQVRRIRYHGGPTLLRQVNDALDQAGLPRFVLKQVSRIGAFYLPLMYKPENEIRLLAKRFPDGGAPIIDVGAGERWRVAIDPADPTAGLELVEIGVRRLDPGIVRSKLPAWCATVPIVVD